MPEGPGRRDLSPQPFIELAETLLSSNTVSETLLRRIASGLFFSLFNYWARLQLEAGRRGKGPSQDRFSLAEFYRDLAGAAADRELVEIMYYRVAADHHAGNPTEVKLYISKSIEYGRRRIQLTKENIRRLIDVARRLHLLIDSLVDSRAGVHA